MTHTSRIGGFSLAYDEEKRIVVEKQTGAVLRASPRPSDAVGFIVFRYADQMFEIDFMVKVEQSEATFIDPRTDKPYQRRVPVRYVVGEDAIAEFDNKFTRAHRRPPIDHEFDNFRRMAAEGIALLANHGNRHPEIFPNGEVLFARHIARRA